MGMLDVMKDPLARPSCADLGSELKKNASQFASTTLDHRHAIHAMARRLQCMTFIGEIGMMPISLLPT